MITGNQLLEANSVFASDSFSIVLLLVNTEPALSVHDYNVNMCMYKHTVGVLIIIIVQSIIYTTCSIFSFHIQSCPIVQLPETPHTGT